MYIAQQIAAHAVTHVIAGRNLNIVLPQALALFPSASPQQRGAAADLSYGTLRHLGEINAYLDLLLSKQPTDAIILGLMQVALYQLLYDEAEAFTVVNQAVNAAQYRKKTWAKSLVNAVLRNFIRQKTTLSTQLNNNEVATFSYPQWWINKIRNQYPKQWQEILSIGNTHPPMILRVNQRKISTNDYLEKLQQHNIKADFLGGASIQLNRPLHVEKIPGFSDGLVSVQDRGAQLAAELLRIHPNQNTLTPSKLRVLDACCAPGGKTGHILELAGVEMLAIDHDSSRLEKVKSNLDRLQLKATLKVGDAANPETWWDGQLFDRIIADVPCTASGVVRRHVDIKWLRQPMDIQRFAEQQTKILPSLWRLLKSKGFMLYVTCSIFEEENQAQITQFLANHADATLQPLELVYNHVSHQHGQLIPSHTHDGFFYALLQKN